MSHLRKSLVFLFAAVLVFGAGARALAETTITTANSSDDTETTSGDANASNSSAAQVGHNGGGETTVASDIDNENATNVQEGDNDLEGSQSATSESGATIGGQVVGGVADGDLTINATNSSTDVQTESGDADATNSFSAFVGLTASSETAIAADLTNDEAINVQEGDNSADVSQRTDAVTGDGVAGQVLGGVATGTVDLVAANTSDDAEATSGDADEESTSGTFTGLNALGIVNVA